MATAPDRVRIGLVTVTSAATADTRAVATAGRSPSEIRAALFEAVPLIVGSYVDGSSALALDWYDEIREESPARRAYVPRPFAVVREDEIAASVAYSTSDLYDLEQGPARAVTPARLAVATETSLQLLEPAVHKEVAAGFWDTMTQNSVADPDAVGWQRFARSGACKFCLMVAGRGAIYSEGTVHFAAHKNCSCVVGPSFDPDAPKASVMQHVASSKKRTPEQRAQLREYLSHHFPDAPG